MRRGDVRACVNTQAEMEGREEIGERAFRPRVCFVKFCPHPLSLRSSTAFDTVAGRVLAA